MTLPSACLISIIQKSRTFHCILLPQDHPNNKEILKLLPSRPDCLLMFSEVQIDNISTAKVSFGDQEKEK